MSYNPIDSIDIFLSHAKLDKERIKILLNAFKKNNLTVWLDDEIPTSDNYVLIINSKLKLSKCVVVIWSKESIEREWVLHEALYAFSEKKLIPVLIDYVNVPVPFNSIHSIDLTSWKGATTDSKFNSLINTIKNKVRNETKGIELIETKNGEYSFLPPTKNVFDKCKYYYIELIVKRKLSFYLYYNIISVLVFLFCLSLKPFYFHHILHLFGFIGLVFGVTTNRFIKYNSTKYTIVVYVLYILSSYSMLFLIKEFRQLTILIPAIDASLILFITIKFNRLIKIDFSNYIVLAFIGGVSFIPFLFIPEYSDIGQYTYDKRFYLSILLWQIFVGNFVYNKNVGSKLHSH